jgi:membrane-associated phospholipid phosphatase
MTTVSVGGVRTPVRRDFAWLAVSLGVFAVCAALVAGGKVGSLEREVFDVINGLPGWLNRPMTAVQYLGVLIVPLVAAAIALAFRRWRLGAALALVAPLKVIVERVPKLLVDRQRPGTTISHAILRSVPAEGKSFTSGHAIIAFAIAVLVAMVLPRRWRLPAIGAAALVGVARIYLGAHAPLDVVGGAAIGVALAICLDLAFGVSRTRRRQASLRSSP